MTDSHTSTGRVGWGMMTPYCCRTRGICFSFIFLRFRTGTDHAVYPPPIHSTPSHSVHAHCCLHSSGFTFAGGPPRTALPPRPAGRRGGGRTSSSESSSSKFISEEIKKSSGRAVPSHQGRHRHRPRHHLHRRNPPHLQRACRIRLPCR